jgi:hypothetical protein
MGRCSGSCRNRKECRYVLETLRGVYHHDAQAREQELSPEDRLRFHQEHSGPLTKGLHEWMGDAVGGAQDGTELRAGKSDFLFTESLAEADAVSQGTRRTDRQ